MTKLYILQISPLFSNSELFKSAYNICPKPWQEKSGAFRFIEDKARAVGAGCLLRYVLKENKKTNAKLYYGENGKPYLTLPGVYFNLSHSGDYVICGFGDHELGCDIEQCRPVTKQLEQHILTENEQKVSAQADGNEDRTDLFFRLWTLKESFLKAVGCGLKISPKEIEIQFHNNDIKILQSLDSRAFSFSEITDIPRYRCSICVTEPPSSISIKRLDITQTINYLNTNCSEELL